MNRRIDLYTLAGSAPAFGFGYVAAQDETHAWMLGLFSVLLFMAVARGAHRSRHEKVVFTALYGVLFMAGWLLSPVLRSLV